MVRHGARVWPALAAAVALCLAAGCSGHPPGIRNVDPALRAQALIDSGNVAFRLKDYPLAARRYAAACVVRKDDPAAYFGLGMALQQMGRDEEARTAFQQARELAQKQRSK